MTRRARPRRLGGMRTTCRLATAFLLLAASGCGNGGSAEDDVRAAWETAAKAVAEGNATEFCTLVSAEGREEIAARTGGLECESAVRLLASRLNARDKDGIRTTEITKVEVQGDEATVSYATTDALAKVGFTGRTSMQRIDERWLLRGS
jgi:hypothetical protein